MALKAVIDAFDARLAALWPSPPNSEVVSGQPNPTIYTPDKFEDWPNDGGAFIALQFPVVSSERITTGSPGNNVFRETGGARFVINTMRGAGITDGLQWADALAALFRGKSFDGVQTQAPSSTFLDDSNDQGLYFQMSFVVPYTYDFYG